jgi:hypothetical protein
LPDLRTILIINKVNINNMTLLFIGYLKFDLICIDLLIFLNFFILKTFYAYF